MVGLLLCAVGVSISGWLPAWLGGEENLRADASSYFFIYACALPAVQLRQLSGSMLQCSGNMKTPSILNAAMCGLDVIFNWLLFFRITTFHSWESPFPEPTWEWRELP